MEEIWKSLITVLSNELHWKAIIKASIHLPIILGGAWLLHFVLKRILKKVEARMIQQAGEDPQLEQKKRIETLLRLVRQGLAILIWGTALLASLMEIGVDVRPVLTSVGILGLAVGFGAQNLVKDLITGFFMILEDQIRVGDVVKLNNTPGLVEKINLRTIVLRDNTGAVHVFPNGNITSLCNMTKDWSAYVFDLGVAYDTDLSKALKVIQSTLDEVKADTILGPLLREEPEIFGVDMFMDSAVTIKGRIRTLPGKQWDVGRAFLRLIKERFEQAGIEIPYPHRKLILERGGETPQPAAPK